jgi:DNA invertase Pin-like site-specific DNA recombinase
VAISTRRAALYVRVSTADRGQTVENQLQPLHNAADRLGWTVVAIHKDEGISGARGREHRPGLDALLKGVTRREYDIVAAWSVCRLGRSLPDLIGFLGELQARGVDLYLHQQALDTSTPSGRMLFGMLSVFSEFERAMIRDRVLAGLHRARSSGIRLGRPRISPFKIDRIRRALDEGKGVRQTARLLKVSPAKVSEVKRAMPASAIPVGGVNDIGNIIGGSASTVARPEMQVDGRKV